MAYSDCRIWWLFTPPTKWDSSKVTFGGVPIAAAREPLPRPTVEVTPGPVDPAAPSQRPLVVRITRDGKTISENQVDGATREQLVRDVVEKMIADPRTAEALP